MTALGTWIERGRTRWLSLQARERSTLTLGGLLLAVILGYFLVISPWLALQARLDAGLPALRSALERMNRLAADAAALKALPVPSTAAPAAGPALQQAIGRMVWPGPAPVLRDDGSGRIQLQIGAVGFNELIAWLEQVQQSTRLRVASANLVRLGSGSGMVRAELVFEDAGSR